MYLPSFVIDQAASKFWLSPSTDDPDSMRVKSPRCATCIDAKWRVTVGETCRPKVCSSMEANIFCFPGSLQSRLPVPQIWVRSFTPSVVNEQSNPNLRKSKMANKPVFSHRLNRIEVTAWKNSTDSATWYNVTFQRHYRDSEGNAQTTNSFRWEDLPLVSFMANKAYDTLACDEP